MKEAKLLEGARTLAASPVVVMVPAAPSPAEAMAGEDRPARRVEAPVEEAWAPPVRWARAR